MLSGKVEGDVKILLKMDKMRIRARGAAVPGDGDEKVQTHGGLD